MPRIHRGDTPDAPRRCAPYEARYDVVRGYDVPPPAAPAEVPRPAAMAAARREERDAYGVYG